MYARLQYHRSRLFLISGLALVFAAGCGGVKGLAPSTVNVSASPSSIAYGATSKISWSSKDSSSFQSSNFGPTDSNFHGGSIVDTPGTTTTYELKVHSDTGNDVKGTAKVVVAPVTKNVVVVGDASKAGPNQIQAFSKTLTTGAVSVSATVPDPTDADGVLIVSSTISYVADAKMQVKKWLDAGKGVVLCGYAPRMLATGESNNTDVSAIGAWFFGVNSLDYGPFLGYGKIRTSGDGLVKLSAVIRGAGDDSTDGEGFLSGAGPLVDSVDPGGGAGTTGSWMSAYSVPTGGKLLWSSSPTGAGNAANGPFQQAYESAFNWVGQ